MDRQTRPPRRERPAGLGVGLAYDSRTGGVRVTRVYPGSPADDAGIRPGDRILLIGDQYVTSPEGLIRTVAQMQPGEQVRLTIDRNGDEQRLTARLTSRRQALNEIRRQRRAERTRAFRGDRSDPRR